MTPRLILTFVLIALSCTVLSIFRLSKHYALRQQWNTTPSISMEHILNIIRYQIEQATPTQISPSIDIIKQLSQENIKNKIIIYLMDSSKNNAQTQSVPIVNIESQVPQKIWRQAAEYLPFLGKTSSIFSIIDRLNMTTKDIQQQANSTSRVIIRAAAQQHKKIKHQLSQPKRLLQSGRFIYLIKFFFSILFIFVCFGVLSSISNMKNQRQTLLYSNFIADVRGR